MENELTVILAGIVAAFLALALAVGFFSVSVYETGVVQSTVDRDYIAWLELYSASQNLLGSPKPLTGRLAVLRQHRQHFDGMLAGDRASLAGLAANGSPLMERVNAFLDSLGEGSRQLASIEPLVDRVTRTAVAGHSPDSLSLPALREFLGTQTDRYPAAWFAVFKLVEYLTGLQEVFDQVFADLQIQLRIAVDDELRQSYSRLTLAAAVVGTLIIVVLLLMLWRIRQIGQNMAAQVAQRTDSLRVAMENLREQERQEIVSQMIFGLSHEINTPLGIAITGTSFMADMVSDGGRMTGQALNLGKLRTGFDLVMDSLHRIRQHLSYFRKLSLDRYNGCAAIANLPVTLDNFLSTLARQQGMKDIRLEWQIDIDSTTTLVVEGIIDVIEELVANSQVHAFMAGNGGTVRILMYANAGGVVLEYRDDGKGPIGVDRSRVFAPFYTTARSEGHMGLGLNIIQNTVHGLYRGKCTLLPGPGFALRIELPCKVSGTAS